MPFPPVLARLAFDPSRIQQRPQAPREGGAVQREQRRQVALRQFAGDLECLQQRELRRAETRFTELSIVEARDSARRTAHRRTGTGKLEYTVRVGHVAVYTSFSTLSQARTERPARCCGLGKRYGRSSGGRLLEVQLDSKQRIGRRRCRGARHVRHGRCWRGALRAHKQ